MIPNSIYKYICNSPWPIEKFIDFQCVNIYYKEIPVTWFVGWPIRIKHTRNMKYFAFFSRSHRISATVAIL